MPGTKSYTNEIVERDVSLAIEHLMIAPWTITAPTVGRISVASPPSGFTHLGGVVEDSPNVTIQRDKYTLATGIPSILQFDAVVGMSGQFSISFYSNSNRMVEYALGAANRKYAATTITSISTATSRTQITVNAATNFSVGDVIVAHASSIVIASNEAQISSISGTTFYLAGYGFQTPPAVADKLGKVTSSELVFGTTSMPRFYLLGVADFLDGVQIQHHFPKVSPVGEFSENIQPGQAPVVQATWDMFATDGGATWGNEFILGRRYSIPFGA